MENLTLLINPETRDLVFDDDGFFKKLFDDDTTAQNVRHALVTWKAEFFADEIHGTDYPRIMGMNQNDINNGDIEEVIREAVFQEPDVSWVDEVLISYENRSITVEVAATLKSGVKIKLEVKA